MTHLPWLLAVVLAVPLGADKEKDKKKEAPRAQQAETPADLVRQAEEKAAAGDKDGATELLRKAAAMPDAGGDVSLKLGRMLEAARELDGALDAYEAAGGKLTGAAKGEALGRLALVQEARGVGDFKQTAEAALAADPEGAFPNMAQARVLAREGKGDEAMERARKAAAASPGPDAQATLGRAHEVRNELEQAEAAYREAGADGSHLAASVGLARVLRRTGRAAEALPLLEKVIAAAPGAVQAYKESARAKIAVGRGAEALGDAATAAALAENDPEAALIADEAAVAKAVSYLAQNQPDLAIQDLTALKEKNPDLAIVRVGLGRAYAAKRQVDQAVAELKKAVELAPADPEANYQLGFVQHMIKRDAAAAVGPYEKAVAAEPGNLEYRTHLGAALAAANQPDRAIEELTKVTGNPAYTRADAWIYLGQAQLGARKYKEAVTALDKARAAAPDNMHVETFLAWAYFGLKDPKNFVEHGKKARALGQKDAALLERLTRVEAGEPIK